MGPTSMRSPATAARFRCGGAIALRCRDTTQRQRQHGGGFAMRGGVLRSGGSARFHRRGKAQRGRAAQAKTSAASDLEATSGQAAVHSSAASKRGRCRRRQSRCVHNPTSVSQPQGRATEPATAEEWKIAGTRRPASWRFHRTPSIVMPGRAPGPATRHLSSIFPTASPPTVVTVTEVMRAA